MRKLLFVISLFFASYGFNQTLEASSRIERNQMRIGEQTTYIISLKFSDDYQVTDFVLPNLESEITAIELDTNNSIQLEVVEFFTDTIRDEKTNITTLLNHYIITSWDTGMFFIDTMKIEVQDTILLTNLNFIAIGDVPVDTTKDIVDIKDIYLEKSDEELNSGELSWLEKNWIWLTIVLVLLIGGVIGWYFYFNKDKEAIEIKPLLPAHQIALQNLSNLKKKDLIKKGKEKQYYSEIADIIRIYLENRYKVRALELTTHEIINRLKFENITPDNKYGLRELLEMADLVKFAKVKPTEMDNDNCIYKAIEFVKSTKFVVEKEETDE